MRGVTVDTHTWLAARDFLLERSDDFYLQLTRARGTFEAEAIHDLRVSSRRLREGIALFGHCFRKRQITGLSRQLKRLITMLGSIRNTDEALLFFTPLVENCDAPCNSALRQIVAVLLARRVGEERQLKGELKKLDPGALSGRIDEVCSNPRIFNPNAGSLFQPVGAYLTAAIAIREKTMLELLPEALIEMNIAAQHRLRVAVKRFRYRMEFLAPLASPDYKGVYSLLKEYQEILGHLHDLDVFSGLSGEVATGQEAGESVRAIIMNRRQLLFAEFLMHHAENPLHEIGRRVRGLL